MIEDAQWLDPLSSDLLAALAQASIGLPVLFLVAAPIGGRERRCGAAARRCRTSARSRLAELDIDSCRQIVITKLAQLGDQLGELPEVLISLVLERAEGNPFYLEELITFIAARESTRTTRRAAPRWTCPTACRAWCSAGSTPCTRGRGARPRWRA